MGRRNRDRGPPTGHGWELRRVAGDHRPRGSDRALYIAGTSGADVIHGSLGSDTIWVWAGTTPSAAISAGRDDIDGGSGNDTLYGMGVAGVDDGNNNLVGGSRRDFLLGGDLDEIPRGGTGQDQMYGGAEGVDTLYGTTTRRTRLPTTRSTVEQAASPDNCFPNGADTIANC